MHEEKEEKGEKGDRFIFLFVGSISV